MTGLTADQAKELQMKFGKNELASEKKESFFIKMLHIISEPMFLLLIVAGSIYFLLGEPIDGSIMLIFIVAVISIDIIQEWRTDKTLNALKDLSAPHIKVIRDGEEIDIASSDLVPGDYMMIFEGVKIPADGIVIKCNDLCVDESSLTGEAEGVWKVNTEDTEASDEYWRKDYCYAGTLVTQGSAIVKAEKIGSQTEYGKIGIDVASAPIEKTPLQRQIGVLVKYSGIIAVILFILVGIFTFFNIADFPLEERIIQSILAGVTLSMAMIPEELPLILTVFLSIGAWKLARKHSLIRKLPSVETLGSVSVLCVDKTGTITMNQMAVENTWATNGNEKDLCRIMGMACETEAYDPMEKAMLKYCQKLDIKKQDLFSGELIKEYAFTNELKMMGHVWKNNDTITIASKGSPERILTVCQLTNRERRDAENKIHEMSQQGLRVIAVATDIIHKERDIPKNITDCSLTLCGLVGLADPPRENVKKDIAICNKAGIRVVMITGDNGITAKAIADKVGMKNCNNVITGDMLESMSDEELREKVKTVSVFSRVIPEHKMRIVKAFKDNGEIVGMTGDGVNDAPALKYADIGIAMGKRGSEVSREAADIILMDDNFSTIVHTVEDGRRIYDNIRKAVGYVFAIHIPIAFSALFAPMLGIDPPFLLLLPLHVVLLELIIDPTCSVVLERQPAERNIMERKPRNPKKSMLTTKGLIKSIAQGLIIFGASFGTYYFMLKYGASVARTMGLVIIMLSSLFIVLVNSSDHDFAFTSMRRLAKDKVMWIVYIATILLLGIIIYSPINSFLKLASLSWIEAISTFGIAFASVFWWEIAKIIKRLK